MRGYTLLLLGVGACGGGSRTFSDAADSIDSQGGGFDSDGFRNLDLRINVLPGVSRESNDVDAAYRALNQTVIRESQPESEGFDVGEIELLNPVIQGGSIVAYQVNPSVAALPGAEVAVEGLVRLRLPDTVQTYAARSDASGNFQTWAVPGVGYRLEIVPDNPLLPITTGEWDVFDPPELIREDLQAGVPIYGRVSRADATGSVAVEGARIHVVDPFGAVSSTALSDEFGLYQIRVTAGNWTLVCEGREHGRDPTLTYSDLAVPDLTGLKLDVAYPTDLVAEFVDGQVLGLDGDPLIGAAVRLTAETLVGYPHILGQDDELCAPCASFTAEVLNSDTGFISPAVVGDYTIAVSPPPDDEEHSPALRSGVPISSTEPNGLDAITLEPFVLVEGTVSGPSGGVGNAPVVCYEVGFAERSWQTVTGDRGGFSLDLPTVPVACVAKPSSAETELAFGWVEFDPAEVGEIGIDLVNGHQISGQVGKNGTPEATAVVEIRDSTDRLLGFELTADDGRFSIPVDYRAAE